MSNLSLDDVLTRGVEQILPSKDGLAKLMGQKKITLYLGIDPTGNQLHLGHSVVLRKLQQFADLGHHVILLIGNGTVKIGDPTGRDKTRPELTEAEIDANFATWKQQASKVLDFSKIEIRKNGDWLDKLTMVDVIKLTSKFTVQQLLERDMFQERMKANLPIFTHEMLYPLLQGYDSVAMDVDLELGGNDQTFNMMVGRQLQRTMNNREKFVLATPLLVGSDGRKMGKSFGNFISMTETAENMFGKLMSIVDDVIIDYFMLLTDVATHDIVEMRDELEHAEVHPMELKKQLAFTITAQYHGEGAAKAAQQNFEKTVQKHEAPDEMPNLQLPKTTTVLEAVMASAAIPSNSEAKRLIEQGGVMINNLKMSKFNEELTNKNGDVLKIGKRHFFSIEVK